MNLVSAFDMYIEQALYAMRDPSLIKFFIWVSALVGHYAIFGLTFVVAIILAYRKQWALVAGLFASVFGNAVTAYILKEMIQRPRPPDFLQAYTASTLYSFPSIHATLSVAFYVFLLWLMYGILPAARKHVTLIAVTILVGAIGFSRLYLGVHYPSDVIAGYIIGGAFVLLGIKIAKKLERKAISSS